ncbi:Peptidase M50 [Corchorus olitorius]|uniref:Peptidase M50 n=1 Tax=Corchorus olitorius TaxID=93759 RepID=A0A1R3I0W4_9ROSI|nr:Peptidase M50 [Corchorus olitorius]
MPPRPRGRPRKKPDTRTKAAIDAMEPFGFSGDIVVTTIQELQKVGWFFIEQDSYMLLIEAILKKVDGEGSSSSQKPAGETSLTLDPRTACSESDANPTETVLQAGTALDPVSETNEALATIKLTNEPEDEHLPSAAVAATPVEKLHIQDAASPLTDPPLPDSSNSPKQQHSRRRLYYGSVCSDNEEDLAAAAIAKTLHVQDASSSSQPTPPPPTEPPLPDSSNSTGQQRGRKPYYGWICSDVEEDLVVFEPGELGQEVERWLCSSCCDLRFQPLLASPRFVRSQRCRLRSLKFSQLSRFCRKREFFCRVTEAETNPDSSNDNEKDENESGEKLDSTESAEQNEPQIDAPQTMNVEQISNIDAETKAQDGIQGEENIEVTSGSPLPGVKPQQLDDSMRIPKATIDILKDQVFGFDTFFVTSQEPYQGGVLFKGNLRGTAAKSYEKISTRMQNKFGDEYKLFLLINPEDDKPVAVVVPKTTLQPETTAVPEWFAAGAFGLVTVFTLLLRNVPALQSNILSTFDNLNLLLEGLPGAFVTALLLGVHELGHIYAANSTGVKLGIPFFVPSSQIGSFGAITRIRNIVPKREDLLKVAAAGPLAGFSLGFVLFLLGFILPPTDGIGVVVDASVFHESFLAGGIAKLLLGDVLKEGTPISVNPLVIWAWAGLLINAINSIPAGELDGGRISFAIWGRKASARLTGLSIVLLGLSSLFNDVAFYWVALIFFLQRGPIAPLSEEITDPDNKYVALGVLVLFLGLLVCLPYPFPFSTDTIITEF